MTKWEYQIITMSITGSDVNPYVKWINGHDKPKDGLRLYDYLQKMGKEGWELVAVRSLLCFLKRPVSN